ncbi:MAG: hypothetical protein ABFQ53_02445, partial [Patescibacteria group bacterium]
MALFAMIEELEQSIVDINSGIVEEFRKAIHSSKNKHQKVYKKNLKMLKKGDIVKLMRLEVKKK